MFLCVCVSVFACVYVCMLACSLVRVCCHVYYDACRMERPEHSRLLALNKLGIVKEYERISERTVLIVGVGGIGSVVAEMLVRCGIGKLILFDYDTVDVENMNRMFYRRDQIGMLKVDAAKNTLEALEGGKIEVFNGNITSVEMLEILRENAQKSDLIVSCVDNYTARITLNKLCCDLGLVWFESGVSETGINGHVQLIRPGIDACFNCAPPTVVAENLNEFENRAGVCTASLATTMSIVAGILVQNILKYFLSFGTTVNNCIGYNGLTDYFPLMHIQRNPDCYVCGHLPYIVASVAKTSKDEPVAHHVNNEWDIQLVTE